jgi:hypothetical protein
LLTAFLALSLHTGFAAPAAFDFENEGHGWSTATPGATITLAKSAGEVRSGSGSLEFAYPAKVGELSLLTGPEVDLEGATSLECWVRTSAPTMLSISLGEKDGSRYEYAFATESSRWHRLFVSLSDFTLAQDSQDEGGALNPEQVNGVSLLDAVPALAGHPELGRLIPQPAGPRKLWLDDLRFSREAAPPRHSAERVVVVDSFESGVVLGLPIGATKAALAKVDGAGVLELTYTPGEHDPDISGIALFVAGKAFTDVDRVRLRARATQAIKLAVSLEEQDGSRYIALTDLPAGPEWRAIELPLSAFSITPDTVDENDRLDISQSKILGVLDASIFTGGKLEKENRITIDEITLIGRKP